jgi:acyl carrier protein
VDGDAQLEAIRSLVADRLDLDVANVKPESRLSTDLGVDSLDFLDLVFSLEDRFRVKLRGSELSFLTRLGSAEEAVIHDGVLTPAALERLSGVLPELGSIPEPRKVTPRELFGMVTVATLWRVVSLELARQAGASGA